MLEAEATESVRYGRTRVYDVTVRRADDGVVIAEFRGRSRSRNGSVMAAAPGPDAPRG